MASAITNDDIKFFNRILDDSANEGYVSGGAYLGGRSCCCICTGGCDKEGVIALAILAFAISFFIGLYYTVRSAVGAGKAQNDLSFARRQFRELNAESNPVLPVYNYDYHSIPAYAGESQGEPSAPTLGYNQVESNYDAPNYSAPPPPYNPHQDLPLADNIEDNLVEVNPVKRDLYGQAVVLLQGRRNERVFAMFSQALMTTGVGFITVALLVSFIVQPTFLTIGMGVGGAGVGVIGLCLYGGKTLLSNAHAEDAASTIRTKLKLLEGQASY